jgi:signal transduction histidine kinase
LATVAEDVLDTADLADRRVHTTLEPAVISGDPVLAERLVANLVDNAVRYTLPRVTSGSAPAPSRAEVT